MIMSRQYDWQMKQKALGNCVICGKKRDKSKVYCEYHLDKVTIRIKKRINRLKTKGY